jgi:hypothetical protein
MTIPQQWLLSRERIKANLTNPIVTPAKAPPPAAKAKPAGGGRR